MARLHSAAEAVRGLSHAHQEVCGRHTPASALLHAPSLLQSSSEAASSGPAGVAQDLCPLQSQLLAKYVDWSVTACHQACPASISQGCGVPIVACLLGLARSDVLAVEGDAF